MSKMGQYRISLQERDEYEQGYIAYDRGASIENGFDGDARKAFELGYHDAYYDARIQD